MNAPTSTAVLAPTVKLLIGGQFVESKTTQWRNVVNPATQEVLARVPFATPEEINAAVASAKEAFKTWKKTPIGTRSRIFLKLQQLIRENMSELAALLTAEQGKTLPDAEGDVFRGLEVVEHAAGIGNLQLGELANNVANGVDTYTVLQPLGVCAGITPFNFPAMIPLWMFPMAIATGNTFVLKPSEQDPMVTMRLVELALEAGIPAGVLNVIHGGEDAVNAICDHKDIKAVSFVGSTKVGTHVFNHFQATEHIALGIGQGLALLGRQDGGQLRHVFADELLVLQEDAGACADGGLFPGLEGFLGRGHGGVDFFRGGKRHAGQHFLRGRVHHVAPLRGLGLDELAADQQFDGRGQHGLGSRCIHGFVSWVGTRRFADEWRIVSVQNC